MALHPELVNRRGVVHPDLLLLRVVPDTHSNVVATPLTPDVVRHLKADDENAHVKLPGSLAQGMGTQELVETAFLGVVVGRVVLVLAFAFTHFVEIWLVQNSNKFKCEKWSNL